MRGRWMVAAMRPRRASLAVLLVLLISMAGMTTAASGAPEEADRLEMYKATVDAAKLQTIQRGGYDVASVQETAGGVEVALVLTGAERERLRGQGVGLEVWRDKQGRTQSQRAALQAAEGFTVWRSFDEPGGLRDEMYQLARRNPQLLKLEVLGKTHQGREYIALKMTQDAREVPDGTRPAVLYVSTYHAREWITPEVNRRLLHWYIDRWRANDKVVKGLLKDVELWFVLVHNPDGYEHTFDAERLWRKNLRDNDANGSINNNDGVDPNRNHAEHWRYDDEGSSSLFPSQTYRGTAPESEPETQAMVRLFDKVPFRLTISYHSFGPLLLYPQGWQTLTPSADDPIYVALTGRDTDPAVPGFNPGVSADLYTTNGEFTDWAHGVRGTLGWTIELEQGCPGCGFVFPDDEALVQAQFEKNLGFAVNVAKSAGDPDDPVSHIGLDTAGLYLDLSQIDPWKTNWPTSDLTVDVSYAGDSSQPVEVLAKRAVGAVTLRYSINGGAVQTAPTSESPDGERYGGNNAYNTYYHYLRGGRSATPSSTGSPAAAKPPSTSRSMWSRTATTPTSWSWPPRTAPAPRPPPHTPARAHRPLTTSRSTRMPSPRTGSTTTCTTSTPWGGRRPIISASSGTTTWSSGTGATTSTCASPAGQAGTCHGWRSTRPLRSAST
jgi:hypothetical protein